MVRNMIRASFIQKQRVGNKGIASFKEHQTNNVSNDLKLVLHHFLQKDEAIDISVVFQRVLK